MRKLGVMLLCVAVVLGVTACGNENEKKADLKATDTTIEETTEVETTKKELNPLVSVGEVTYVLLEREDGTKEVSIDVNEDGTDEVFKISSKGDEEFKYDDGEIYAYDCKAELNGETVIEYDNVEVIGLGFVDIDPSDSTTEVIIYVQELDDKSFGIYKYEDGKLVNLNEEINNKHIEVTAKGDGKLSVLSDESCGAFGCFYMTCDYEYKDGFLVPADENEICDITPECQKFEYVLTSDIQVFEDVNCKKEVGTLKKGTKLNITKTKKSDATRKLEDWEDPYYFSAFEVKVNGKIAGWVSNKEVFDYEYDQIFESYPAWD